MTRGGVPRGPEWACQVNCKGAWPDLGVVAIPAKGHVMKIDLEDGPVDVTGNDDSGQSPVNHATAAERLAAVMSTEAMDALLADTQEAGIAVDGPDGLIQRMIKAVLERALDVEMADHLLSVLPSPRPRIPDHASNPLRTTASPPRYPAPASHTRRSS